MSEKNQNPAPEKSGTETAAQAPAKIGVELSDGRLASFQPVLGKHIRQARKMQAEAGHDHIFALVALTTTINGQAIVPEDLDDMPGGDVVKLLSAVEGNLMA